MTLSNDELVDIVRRHTIRLTEHFTSVQVIAVRAGDGDGDEECTSVIKWGTGSWFERYGAVRAWVEQGEEENRQEIREPGGA